MSGALRHRELSVPRGRVQHFRGGSVYWSPRTGPPGGARGDPGDVRPDRGERLTPRPAVTDEGRTPRAVGAFSHFEDGSVYWSPTTGAKVVRGSIRATWAAQGWETGPLGFPTSDEFPTATGRAATSPAGAWSSRPGTEQ